MAQDVPEAVLKGKDMRVRAEEQPLLGQSLVLQHRTEGLYRSQGIPARLPEAAAAAAGRAVVAPRNVGHYLDRFQFGDGSRSGETQPTAPRPPASVLIPPPQ
jgi:hypothetical protein